MELILYRKYFTKVNTIGELFINGDKFCDTLEDTDRFLEAGGTKVSKQTAIPRGTYKVRLTYSDRFGRVMPLVENVPQFTGIRIHIGNTEADTDGCILFGTKQDDHITASKVAFDVFMRLFTLAIDSNEEVILEIQ
jgi:hypothetical protein